MLTVLWTALACVVWQHTDSIENTRVTLKWKWQLNNATSFGSAQSTSKLTELRTAMASVVSELADTIKNTRATLKHCYALHSYGDSPHTDTNNTRATLKHCYALHSLSYVAKHNTLTPPGTPELHWNIAMRCIVMGTHHIPKPSITPRLHWNITMHCIVMWGLTIHWNHQEHQGYTETLLCAA